jgi:hypothetical protein
MYTTCLFCSASLGTNEAIESFPVGTRVAFDVWKGRLWAVCSRCGRWNLAPIEERWEAVEEAERLYRDSRARVHSENIGIARVRDGTRLVRVGEALPGEMAAWRYGGELISRRRRNMAGIAAVAVVGGAVVAGLPLLMSAGVPLGLLNAGIQFNSVIQMQRAQRRVVHRVTPDRSPTGAELIVRRLHLHDAVLTTSAEGGVGLKLPAPSQMHAWKRPAPDWKAAEAAPLELAGDDARRLLARVMMDYNSRGASSREVDSALRDIEAAGGADAYTRATATTGAIIMRSITRKYPSSKPYTLRQIAGTFRGEILPVTKYRDISNPQNLPKLSATQALALEMALNEEQERAALDGELAALEAAWREAEEIAHIADSLPGEPPPTAVSSRRKA